MDQFHEGEYVYVPCSMWPGAFPSEYLVTVEARDGEYSGFVETKYVRPSKTENNRGHIEGIVRDVKVDGITVQLPGAFLPRLWD